MRQRGGAGGSEGGWKIWWFRGAVALAAPAGLLLLEGLLRVLPGSGPPPLVVELARHEGRTLRSINADYARRFFFERDDGALIASGRMAGTPFLEPAEEGQPRLRVVTVGASTVQGYPHPSRLAAASFLQAMLADAQPQRHVEVINLGITSLASFAVARVLDDALAALRPDLVVVYSGHNEFYGIYGSGTGHPAWYPAVHYRLLDLRLARVLQAGVEAVRGHQVTDRSLLEVQARHGDVLADSPRRVAAAAALRGHLEAMVRACDAAGSRLVLCTLAANDADFAPAGADTTGQSAAWVAQVQAAERLLAREPDGPADRTVAPAAAAQARRYLAQARALTPGHAYVWFLEGQAWRALGEADSAAAALRQARDLDTMPWRAPTAHSDIVRTVARHPGVALADAEAAFGRHAGPGGPGFDLMVDHVHPGVAGQALLARTIVSALVQAGWLAAQDSSRIGSDAAYRLRLGDLPVERAGTQRAMADLLASPPMDRYNGTGARRLRHAADALWQGLDPAVRRGALAWERGGRDEVPLVLAVADELLRAGDLKAAASHYQASIRQAPYTPRGDVWAVVQWAWCRRLGGQAPDPEVLAAARQRLEFVAQTPAVSRPFMDLLRGEVDYFRGDGEAARQHLEAAWATGQLEASFYYTLLPPLLDLLVADGRLDEARRHAHQAAETTRNPYFRRLVEALAAGGHFLPPLAPAATAG